MGIDFPPFLGFNLVRINVIAELVVRESTIYYHLVIYYHCLVRVNWGRLVAIKGLGWFVLNFYCLFVCFLWFCYLKMRFKLFP